MLHTEVSARGSFLAAYLSLDFRFIARRNSSSHIMGEAWYVTQSFEIVGGSKTTWYDSRLTFFQRIPSIAIGENRT